MDIYADNEDPVNFEYSKNWMKDIPDNVYLSSVNIPGTHDSGTASVFQDDVAQLSLSSCQKYYYGEQLNIGIRSMEEAVSRMGGRMDISAHDSVFRLEAVIPVGNP